MKETKKENADEEWKVGKINKYVYLLHYVDAVEN
jgi:hypothetical protein